MKKSTFFLAIISIIALFKPTTASAEKYEFGLSGNVDLVSDYIWRGMYQYSGFSVQPGLDFSYGNVTLGFWGSQSLTAGDGAREFDITLSYKIWKLNIAVTDYWWGGINCKYGDYKNDHHFEGAISYTVSEKIPLTIGWATMFAGGDKNKNGKYKK